MSDGPNIGYATLSLIPSLRGSESKLDAESKTAGERAGGSFSKSFKKVVVAGVAAGVAGVTAFAAKSAATFSRVGTEVAKLGRFTGLAAEDASRLRFAGEESGIGIDTMTRSLGILSKAVVGTKLDKLKLGLKDAHGKAKPLNQDLLIIAKRFQAMPDGIEKNALAMQLFGRSGAELIPFLNKGADGIAELEKESDKFGQTLSTKDLAAVKASTIAHRQFSAAMEGLQIQVGRYVLPVITKFVTFATSGLLPAIHTVGDLVGRYLGPAFDFAFGIIDRVSSRALSFFTTRFLPGMQTVIAQVIAILKPFAVKFWGWFERVRVEIDTKLTPAIKTRLTGALERLVAFIKNNAAPTLAALGGAGALAAGSQLAGVAGSVGSAAVAMKEIANPTLLAAAALAALAGGFVYLYQHSQRFQRTVKDVGRDVGHFFDILRLGSVGAGPFDTKSPVLAGLFTFARTLRATAFDAKAFWHALSTGKTFDMGASEEGVQRFGLKVRKFVGVAVGYIRKEFADLTGFFRAHWGEISEAGRHVFHGLQVAATVVVNVVSALWRAWGDDLTRIVKTVFGGIAQTISTAVRVIRDIIEIVLDVINGDWGKAWDALKDLAHAALDYVGSQFSVAYNLIKEILGGILSTIGVVFQGIWDKVSGVVGGIVSFIGDHWRGLLEILTGPIGLAVVFITDHLGSIVGFVSGVGSAIASVASTMWNGLKTGLGAVVDFISSALDDIVSFFVHTVNAAIDLYNKIPLVPNLHHVGEKQNAPTLAVGKAGAAALAAHSHKFAAGGRVDSRPGGLAAILGEGRFNENVIPNSRAGVAPLAAELAAQLGPQRPDWYRSGDVLVDDRPIYVTIDGKVVARANRKQDRTNRRGRPAA